MARFERGLRKAYAQEFDAGRATQSSLAAKLDVHRSVLNRRLTGRTNMTLETLAETLWALGWDVEPHFHPIDSRHLGNRVETAPPSSVEMAVSKSIGASSGTAVADSTIGSSAVSVVAL